jgi:hypothetical protein
VKHFLLPAVLGASLLAAGPVAGDTIWVEGLADAGDLPGTAQVTDGTGALTAILGNLDLPETIEDGLDIDLFKILILDPAGFSASTIGSAVNDPQLFLFDAAGLGVFMNDDDPTGFNGSQSALGILPDGSTGGLPGGFGPGIYFLAIGWFDNEPVDALSALLFSGEVPDPIAGPLAGWDNNVTQRVDLPTAYEITLTGTAPAIPEPATMTLLGTGLAAAMLRRRRGRRDRS